MIDLTCDRLEQAVLPLLEMTAPTLIAVNTPVLDDTFEGFIVQSRHQSNDALSNDGKLPVLSTYALEIVLRTSSEPVLARRKASGGALMAFIAQELQTSVNAVLREGESLPIVNVSIASEEVYITESSLYEFNTTLNIVCQPLIGTEEGE